MKPSEKVKVRLDPRADGVMPELPEDLSRAMKAANWTADPGTGKAILLADGSELLNPVPFEPPVDYVKQDSIMDMIDQRLKARLAMLDPNMVLDDSPEDANDFDIDDEIDPLSIYEVLSMKEDYPGRDPNEGSAPKVPEKILEEKEDTPIPDGSPKDDA